MKDRTRHLAALYDVTAVASSSLDLETLPERSLDRILEVMGSGIGSIRLCDPVCGTLRLATARGMLPGPGARSDGALDQGLADWVLRQDRPAVVPEAAGGWTAAERPLPVEPHAAIGVPIHARGRVTGVLSVVRDRTGCSTRRRRPCWPPSAINGGVAESHSPEGAEQRLQARGSQLGGDPAHGPRPGSSHGGG